MASPSTYRLNMQNTAAIGTVSWISRSVASAALAWATSSAVTLSPLCCTAAAIASKVFNLVAFADNDGCGTRIAGGQLYLQRLGVKTRLTG